MPARVWGRAGWALFAAAAIGLIVYTANVGLAKASLIATVADLFVGAAGLFLALVARHSTGSNVVQTMVDVSANRVEQQAHGFARATQYMKAITARTGHAVQLVRASDYPAARRTRRGKRRDA